MCVFKELCDLKKKIETWSKRALNRKNLKDIYIFHASLDLIRRLFQDMRSVRKWFISTGRKNMSSNDSLGLSVCAFPPSRLHGNEVRRRDAADVRSVLHPQVVWWR